MKEVARIVVDGAHADRSGRLAQSDIAEIFRRVAHPRRESRSACRPGRIVLQQPAVFLHRRSAARGVHDDRFDREALEGGDVAPRERAGPVALARMRVQRAAAGLRSGDVNLDAVPRQHPRGGAIGVSEDASHHASGEERHGAAACALGGHDRLHPLGGGSLRQELEHLGEPSAGVQTARAQERRHLCSFRGDGKRRERGEHATVREQPVECRGADRALDRRGPAHREDLRARRLHELPVLHA